LTNIYLSDWNPRGVRSNFERCSVSNADAQRIFGEIGRGNVTDACGWFDENDKLRILVADTDTGHRLTARTTKRNWSITISYPDDRAASPESSA